MKILDGKFVAKEIRKNVKKEVIEIEEKKGIKPKLTVVIVGNDPASQVYVRNKEKACEKVGFLHETIRLDENIEESDLITVIEQLNDDKNCNGILVQLPLPKHISEKNVIDSIEPVKDVDGFHCESAGKLLLGQDTFVPCTPQGIIEILNYYNLDIQGKHAVVLGRSNIVGKPVSFLLQKENATVTMCHSKTVNLESYTRQADILVAAIGKAEFITAEHIKKGVIIIDVGMNYNTKNVLCGDVDFEQCKDIAEMITPVPGGIGPMTIAMLLKNTLKAFKMQL